MANEKVKGALKSIGMPQWAFAKIVGISESQLSKYLREEWSDSAQSVCFEMIEVIASGGTPSKEQVQKFRDSLMKKCARPRTPFDYKRRNIDRIIDEMREKRISEEWGF